METIEVNGKKYVNYEEYERLQESNGELLKKQDSTFRLMERQALMDEANVMAITIAELKGEWFASHYSIEFLEKALKIIRLLSIFPESKKNKNQSVDIVCSKDYPLMIGRLNRENGRVTGICIAPRVLED